MMSWDKSFNSIKAETVVTAVWEEYLRYELLEDGTYSVCNKDRYGEVPKNARIPATYNGKAVTAIKENGFASCYSLESVVLPDCITSIGESAFRGCYSLESVVLPDGITSIGESAFRECYSLESVVLPDTLASIGALAFNRCYSLISLNIPDNVTWIGGGAFINEVEFLPFVQFEEEVFYAGNWAVGCSNATNLSATLRGGTAGIAQGAFASNLVELTIPDSVDYVCGTFQGCSNLASVLIGNGITSIIEHAFEGLRKLESVTIGSSVTSIGAYAFAECKMLSSVMIGSGVTSIGAYAFQECTMLSNITIPDSVVSIDSYTFYSCDNLANVTLGVGLTEIGNGAFCFCKNLVSLTIPAGVVFIGSYSFYGCDSLASVTFTNTQGWSVFTEYTLPTGTAVVLTDSAQNAIDLRSKYADKYLKKM